MKIQCEKKDLLAAIVNVSRAAPSKSPVPALEGILTETTENGLKLTAYDTKIGIYTTIPTEVAEEGRCVIPARFLGDLVRKLPDGLVKIECDERMNISIRCGKSEFHVAGYDPQEFPELEAIREIDSVMIPEGLLKNMINQTIFAVSDSETRPIYTGILFEVGETELTLVAVDGYRLAKRSESTEMARMNPCSFVIPGSTLNDVEKICNADSAEPVVISLGEKHASFAIGNTVLISRRLEGEFMNYRKSIPTNFRYEIFVEREEMIQVLERISLVIKEKHNSPSVMIIDDGRMEIYCSTSFAHAEDVCLCEGNGEGMKIGFNSSYFLDALRAAGEEKLKLSLNTSSSPIIIEAAEGGKYLYMVLPVRLRDND
ncbi:MAG: DNA polymerase III subunit beta [Oscillospiraceae bacterium]|nr:DNA polymerase III subunit beta [Oscillospiraceae bacterium]